MHARIDVLMRLHFGSLLPSRVSNWVVIIVSVHYQSTPPNMPLHPVSIVSTTLHAVCTGLSSFQLVPMSTVPAVQDYIFGSVSLLGQHIVFPRGAHHIYIYIKLFHYAQFCLIHLISCLVHLITFHYI